MDIRTKLVFALVGVALLSMLGMGVAVSSEVDGIIRQSRLENLDELAELRRQSLLWIIEGWRDRADLIASRTQLRAALEELGRSGNGAAAGRVRALLQDAVQGARAPSFARVYDARGELVAAAASPIGQNLPPPPIPAAPPPPSSTRYVGVELNGSETPQVTFATPMTWDERVVGSLVATFQARELAELAGSYEGLGETGETIVFTRDASGTPRMLHATRHGGMGPGTALPGGPESLAARALDPEQAPPSDGWTDYRGEPVWAATRLVEDTGWGLIVKIDNVEEAQAFSEFAAWLRRTALTLAAFAILAGAGFGMRFALPIHALAEVANRIRGGEMSARAKVTVEDEVGALTRDFNAMADELEHRMEQLREFQKFFDVSIDLMCIAGTDGYFRRVNPAFERALGWSEDELVASPFFDFVHPDDIEKTQHEVAKLAQGIPTISFENRYRRKDGRYALLRWTSYPESGRLYAIAHVLEESLVG